MQAILALVGRRAVFAVLVLILSSVLVFAGTGILPGDALEVSIPPDQLDSIPPEELAARRAELGLDRPPHERYLTWLAGAMRLDFGVTILNREPVFDMIARPLLNTLLMAAVGLLVVPGAAFALGVWAALKPGGRVDAVISSIALLGYSIPEFVLGNVLVLIFAVWLPWQPAVITLPTDAPPLALLAVLTLPIATLFLASTAYQLRLVRTAMISVLASDFVERARLAGLSEWRVVLRHALPVAAIPALAATAQFVAALVSGLLVIEIVFNYPGLGVRVVEAIGSRDVGVIQAIGFLAALGVLATNLLADIAIIALDPRVRSSTRD